MSPVLYQLSYPDIRLPTAQPARRLLVAGLGIEPRPKGYEPSEQTTTPSRYGSNVPHFAKKASTKHS